MENDDGIVVDHHDASFHKAETTEASVKKMIRQWFKNRGGWCFSPVSNGMGVHGIPDIIGCVPVSMDGVNVGVMVAIEAKRPGRRGQPNRGASPLQSLQIKAIQKAGGIATVCDGADDLDEIDHILRNL